MKKELKISSFFNLIYFPTFREEPVFQGMMTVP